MRFWEDLKYAVKVFLDDPIEYVKDPANAVLTYSVKERIAGGESTVLIETALESKGFVKGSTWEDIKKVGNGVMDVAEFGVKHGAQIVIIGAILFGVYYLFGLKRIVKG